MRPFKIQITSFIIFIVSLNLCAQAPEYMFNSPSPNIGSLLDFQEQDVSLYSGTANITVPIYNLQDNAMEHGLSLGYNSRGVKPDEHPGWVGMNWNLKAGGSVTRKVNGIPDEAQFYKHVIAFDGSPQLDSTSVVSLGYGYYFDELDGTDWHTNSELQDYVDNATFELEPDEFIFNFGNYSGSFFLNHEGEWVVRGNPAIKIEIQDPLLLILGYWGYEQGDNPPTQRRLVQTRISGMRITTPDGFKYEFGIWDRQRAGG